MPSAGASLYRYVDVIGLRWEGHNHQARAGPVTNSDQEFNLVMNAFRNYGFSMHGERIPADKRRRDGFGHYLQQRLSSGKSRLVIIYYQGHGVLDKRNELILSNGNGSFMHFSEVGNTILSARVDVLILLNCCHAGAALNTPWRPHNNINYENHIKDIIMAVPANKSTKWGHADDFAPALEQALREKHQTWPRGFHGTPAHWAEAISRIMRSNVGVRHLVAYPPQRKNSPIVVARAA